MIRIVHIHMISTSRLRAQLVDLPSQRLGILIFQNPTQNFDSWKALGVRFRLISVHMII